MSYNSQFSLSRSCQILARTPSVIRGLLHGLDEFWLAGNEGPDTWSPREILGHLIFGEKTDWVPRIKIVLVESGPKHFEPFDRLGHLQDMKGKSADHLFDEFATLRKTNLEYLTSLQLSEQDLKKTGIHAEFGNVTLEQLIASWVVHDLTHLNQISRVMARQYLEDVGPWRKYMGVYR